MFIRRPYKASTSLGVDIPGSVHQAVVVLIHIYIDR